MVLSPAFSISLPLQLLLLSSIAVTFIHAQECASDGTCDKDIRCPFWEQEGECHKNAAYMKKNCPVTCGYYASSTGGTNNKTPEELVHQTNQFGVEQVATGDRIEQTLEVISNSIEYMKELNNKRIPRRKNCKNLQEYCSFWTTVGTFVIGCSRPVVFSL